MPSSGTTTFALSRDDLIAGALRLCKAYGPNDPIPAVDILTCAQALNILTKELAIEGLPLWCLQDVSMPNVAGQAYYDVSTAAASTLPLRVLDAYIRDAVGNDTPLTIQTRWDDDALGTKTAQGVPNQCYYDPQIGAGTLIVRPVPVAGAADFQGTIAGTTLTVVSTTIGTVAAGQPINGSGVTPGSRILSQLTPTTWQLSVASTVDVAVGMVADAPYTIYVVVQRQLEDFNLAEDNPDFPQEAFRLLKWCLADEIALEYQCPVETRREINQKAVGYRDKFFASQQDQASLFFTPSERSA